MKVFHLQRSSLVFRIALPFALLLLATMGMLSFYLSVFIRQSYLDILENNLKSEAHLTADRMAALMIANDPSAMEARVRLYSDLLGVRVTIVSSDGTVLGESNADPNEMENHLNRPEIQRALQKTVSTEMRFSNTLQTQMLYAAAPMLDGERVLGVARLAVSLDTIRRNENNLLGSMLIATGIATGLAILLAVLIATYTIAPLRELTLAAQRIASGNRDDIVMTMRYDEIGRLQRAFSDMAYRLKEQIDELNDERGKMAAVLSNMTDGVIMVNGEGYVELVNPAVLRLFNIQAENALGKSLIEVVRHHQMAELWRRSLQTGEQQSNMIETAPDRLYIQEIATPLNASMPERTLLVFQDLTRVRKLETVRQDFVSNVSHELRTPLASLKAITETLQEGALEDPAVARRFLGRMEMEIDNLTQMVQELLELSRIESGKVPLRRRPVSPCEMSSPAVERMAIQAERAGLQLCMDCPADLPLVLADPDRLEQVLVNLIHNAIKFTSPGGEIKVSAYAENKQVIFNVRDSGVGIPPEALTRIFERFYKADRSRSGKGTGLGLSIARHIIEAHGGRIWAESVVNQGSTFYFSLPIA